MPREASSATRSASDEAEEACLTNTAILQGLEWRGGAGSFDAAVASAFSWCCWRESWQDAPVRFHVPLKNDLIAWMM